MHVRNAAKAIDLLGGTAEVAAMFHAVSPKTVSMWRTRGLPARSADVLAPELRRRSHHFSPKLFRMLEPRRASNGRGREP